MSDLGNKEVFAKNLRHYMAINNLSRQQMCDALGVSYSTFSDWYNGIKYPRIDKIEMMANYFNIQKSDLIESMDDKQPEISQVYLSFARSAQDAGILPEDIQAAIQIIKLARGETGGNK